MYSIRPCAKKKNYKKKIIIKKTYEENVSKYKVSNNFR